MIKKISVFFGFSGLVLVLVLSSSRPALAANLFVDDDSVECPEAEFTIIRPVRLAWRCHNGSPISNQSRVLSHGQYRSVYQN